MGEVAQATPMNYRHAYHAGNHADVLKHAVLARVIQHLRKKEKPFRVVDAHAGIGLYRLDAPEAAKTLEWQDGVGRLYSAGGGRLPLNARAEALLAPWRQVVEAVNGPDGLKSYPGSPEIARLLMRADDALALNELHPEDFATLASRFGQDKRVALTKLDAGVALKALLPPPERRGLVLIDPPYEATDECEQLAAGLAEGLKRFATGIFCIWYPVTGDNLDVKLAGLIRSLGVPLLQAELRVRKAVLEGGLAGSGLLILNPPWKLDEELSELLPSLSERLSQGKGASVTLA